MRAGDGRGGSQGSAPPVEPCAQCLCPCSSPVRVVASKTNAAPGPPPATVMAWTILHRGPLPAGGVTHGPSSARYQGHGRPLQAAIGGAGGSLLTQGAS